MTWISAKKLRQIEAEAQQYRRSMDRQAEEQNREEAIAEARIQSYKSRVTAEGTVDHLINVYHAHEVEHPERMVELTAECSCGAWKYHLETEARFNPSITWHLQLERPLLDPTEAFGELLLATQIHIEEAK